MLRNKMLMLGFLLVLLLAIPLTIYLLQKQQEIRSRATPATTLNFTPASTQAAIGSKVSFDITVNPGSNLVNTVRLVINYDTTKIATASADTGCGTSICVTGPLTTILDNGPTYSVSGTTGTIQYELTSGFDVSKLISSSTKIATVTFQALALTTSPTQIFFDTSSDDKTSVFSANCNLNSSGTCPDPFGENVLLKSSIIPASLAIISTPTPTPGPTTPNLSPTCDSFITDRTASGIAPFSIAFTATGNDTDGTISKITFNFGDGPVQDVKTGGGIGTNSVSLQISHTYNNAGTYSASAILTDNSNAISSSFSCSQTVTVSSTPTPTGAISQITPTLSPTTSSTSSATPSAIPTSTLFVIVTPLPSSSIPIPKASPGPSGTVVGVGIAGAIISIVGAALFFIL